MDRVGPREPLERARQLDDLLRDRVGVDRLAELRPGLQRLLQRLARAFRDQKASGLFELKGDPLGLAPAADAGTLKPNGNNVDLDLEMAKMVRNQSLHATATALLAQQFSLMREAISGRVSA